MVNPDNTTVDYVPPDENSYKNPTVGPVKMTDKSSQDFKKILGKSKDDKGDKKKSPANLFADEYIEDPYAEEIVEKTEKDDEENASQGVSSLFDLSKKSEAKQALSAGGKPQGGPSKVESPSDLFKRMSSPRQVQKEIAHNEKAQNSKATQIKQNLQFSSEQADLTYVNPLAVQASVNTDLITTSDASKTQRPVGIDPNLALLIEKIVKQMYTVEKSGQTDTVMIIDYPPLFKDAKITVSAFESAKGQFNISIENLTQQAQKVLELDSNKKSLLNELENKGYNIQIFTTTTAQAESIHLPEQQASPDKNRREDEESEHREGG